MNDAQMTLAGNLVEDPELRFTPAGQPVAKFRVASTPRYKDSATGEWKDGDSLFLTCTVWRQAAENVAESLKRGMRVIVTGRLKQRSYETREGEKRTVYELEVDEVGPSLRNASAKVAKVARTGAAAGQPARRQRAGRTRGPARAPESTATSRLSRRSQHEAPALATGRGGRFGVSVDELREHDEDGQDDQELGEQAAGQAAAALGGAGAVDPAVAVLVVETTRHCGLLAAAPASR